MPQSAAKLLLCLPVLLQESFGTTVVVFVMFQLPMLVWLMQQRRLKATE